MSVGSAVSSGGSPSAVRLHADAGCDGRGGRAKGASDGSDEGSAHGDGDMDAVAVQVENEEGDLDALAAEVESEVVVEPHATISMRCPSLLTLRPLRFCASVLILEECIAEMMTIDNMIRKMQLESKFLFQELENMRHARPTGSACWYRSRNSWASTIAETAHKACGCVGVGVSRV